MYDIVEYALAECGAVEPYRDAFVDRGDGLLVLIRPVDQVPKTALLTTFVPVLSHMLARHNDRLPGHRFRLRLAIHAGEVHFDRMGPFGEAVDVACRLLEAPELKARLARSNAPLVLVVSDDVYRCVIKHGYAGIDSRTFIPVVRVDVGGSPRQGWVRQAPWQPGPVATRIGG